jgi:hypothetical protein
VNGKDVADGAAPSNRPLAVGAEHGHLDIVELMLAAGARVDACCCSCATALHYAIRGGYPKIVARLLDAGADPDRLYDGTLAPLELARQSGNPEIVRLLEQRVTIGWLRVELAKVRQVAADQRYETPGWRSQDVSSLVGMSRTGVKQALGEPDLLPGHEGVSDSGRTQWRYAFFRLAGRMGGGPTLALRFDQNGACDHAQWVLTK